MLIQKDVKVLVRLVSSANITALKIREQLGKSFMYIRNSNGPRIDPCGTPVVTFCSFEYIPLYFVIWIRFDR